MLGLIDAVERGSVHGWLWDPRQPAVRQTATLRVDGAAIAQATADRDRPDLGACGIGDGRHGFVFTLPRRLLDNTFHTFSVTAGSVTAGSVTAGAGPAPVGGELRAWLLDDTAPRCPPVAVVARPKPHTLAVCAIVRDEGPYLLEWIAYHRAVGVDHFIVFDNASTDSTADTLARLAAAGILTAIPWPSAPFPGGPQVPAYTHAVHRFRNLAEWLAFIDLDEFLVPTADADLPSLLRRYPDVTGLAGSWRVFGTAGRTDREPGLVMDRFRRCARPDDPLHAHVKSIVRADYVAKPMVHAHVLREGAVVDEQRRPVPLDGGGLRAGTSVEALQVNHYVTKSLAEWEAKRARGRADRGAGAAGHRRDAAELAINDRNEAEDTAILRFRDATIAEMARLEALVAAAPHGPVGGRPADPAIPPPPPALAALDGGGGADGTRQAARLVDALAGDDGLRPGDRVLDIGCGIGRLAGALAQRLGSAIRYDGVDAHRPHVDWCTAHITVRHPGFRFHHADIRDAALNPLAATDALAYRFPFADGRFRAIALPAAAARMLEPEIAAHLKEVRRMLAPGGRVLAGALLLNAEARRAVDDGRCAITFDCRGERCWTFSRDLPEVAMAYPEAVMHDLFAAAGLQVRRIDLGSWTGRDAPGGHHHDLITAVPAP